MLSFIIVRASILSRFFLIYLHLGAAHEKFVAQEVDHEVGSWSGPGKEIGWILPLIVILPFTLRDIVFVWAWRR
jgi:hypothetical protein